MKKYQEIEAGKEYCLLLSSSLSEIYFKRRSDASISANTMFFLSRQRL